MRMISPGPMAALVAGCILVAMTSTAPAADAIFPPTSRIGLAPPAGFIVSKEFMGFEDRDKKAAILLVELPPEAYAQIEKGTTADILKGSGATVDSTEPFTLGIGPAVLIVGRQSAENLSVRKWVLVAAAGDITAAVTVQVPDGESETYPDAAIRAALSSLTVRAAVPVEEQLAILPFVLKDLAGFRPVRGRPRNAALLTDGPRDVMELSEQPLILITAMSGVPPEPSERDRFARTLFAATPAVKEIRLTRAEPQRIAGQAGYEIVADAKDMQTNTDVTVAQWLRFGSGGYLHMLAISRKDAWAATYPRFRAVRDGIDPK